MPSATYRLFREAIRTERQVFCTYDGHRRELCPVILGLRQGEERVLAYQIGGTSSQGLPSEGDWKCLKLSRIEGAALHDGLWREGPGHAAEQRCVEEVELDINIHVRRLRSV